MPDPYAVPFEDIEFALRHVARVDEDHSSAEDRELRCRILKEAGRFAIERLLPLNLSGDLQGASHRGGEVRTPAGFAAAYRDWAAGGWMAVAAPERWGGSNLPPILTAPLDEVWNSANMAFYLCPILTQAAIKLLIAVGTEEQQQEYLPALISGEWTASMGLTEPSAGSDLSLVATEAVPAANGTYRIRGQKVFTSYGDHDWGGNIVNLVLARIAGAPRSASALSLFIVPHRLPNGDANDVLCVGIEHKLGLRASPTCTMSYGARRGATAYLLGKENGSLAAMFVMMNKARIACALQAVGLCERALQQARSYAASRRQGRDQAGATVELRAHPDVRRTLLRMAALTAASRALAYATVAAVETEGDGAARVTGAMLTPLAKVFSSEAACEVAHLNIQVHGGIGYVEESGVAQILRDACAIPIYEGTNGIQSIDFMNRKVIADRGDALLQLTEMATGVAERLIVSEPLMNFAQSLMEAAAQVDRAATWLLQDSRSAEERLAAAVPFTRLCGIFAAGAYLGMGLANSLECGELSGASPVHPAVHYGDAILPQCGGLAKAVLSSAHVLVGE